VIYDIRQITSYSYASKVSYARHVLRLTPVDRPGQHVHASALDIDPVPVGRRAGTENVAGAVGFGAACAAAHGELASVPARLAGLRDYQTDLVQVRPESASEQP